MDKQPESIDPEHQQAYDKLMGHMRRALVERRQVIDIGNDFQVRFQKRGETWDHGDNTLEARESGLFVLFPVEQGGKRVDGRWLHHGSTDDLEETMKNFLAGHTTKQLADLSVIICADGALQEMARENAARRERSAAARP